MTRAEGRGFNPLSHPGAPIKSFSKKMTQTEGGKQLQAIQYCVCTEEINYQEFDSVFDQERNAILSELST